VTAGTPSEDLPVEMGSFLTAVDEEEADAPSTATHFEADVCSFSTAVGEVKIGWPSSATDFEADVSFQTAADEVEDGLEDGTPSKAADEVEDGTPSTATDFEPEIGASWK